jgi:hypothetical protein
MRSFLKIQAALWSLAAAFTLAVTPAHAAEPADSTPLRWWKGNLHTHSLWSDGDDYPEMIAAWYKDAGYHFLTISDHNVMLEGQRWFPVTEQRGGGNVLARYRERFGSSWVQERQTEGRAEVRLKPLNEFRALFEEAQKFLLIASEEITDRHLTAPIHINATNLRDYLPPQGGSNVLEVMQRNVDAVLEQRERTGQPMFPHINHPNFGWAITAEELMRLQGEQFFEVYNGHPAVRNEGDALHASLERMWDIILSWRLAVLNLPPMFGLAVDDAHNYHDESITLSNPGRGWVMVRASHLTPESLVHALEAGDFYSSTGVTLKEIRPSSSGIKIEIAPQSGVTYRTQFIGTRRGFNQQNEPIRTAAGEALRITHRYTDEIGMVLAEVEGPAPAYTFKGDELYVRAKVISSKPKSNPYQEGEMEVAWTQPVVPPSPSTATRP